MNSLQERYGKAERPRLKTDRFFQTDLTVTSSAPAMEAVRFIEEKQLLNPVLWETFVEQFASRPDTPDTGWRGEYWGKMMRAGCFVYTLTRSPALYQALKRAVLLLLETADDDGRISSYGRDGEYRGWDLWCRKYVLLGLEYFYELCPEEDLKQTVLTAAVRHADVIVASIGDGEGQKSVLESSQWWGCINSCSILEPIVRLYSLTGKQSYLDFASYLISSGGSNQGNIFRAALENRLKPYQYPTVKAYETMSFFEGVLEYYRVTGDEDCKTAVLHFTDGVLETDYTLIGNCGCTHELFDNSSLRQTEAQIEVMQETCVAVTLIKLLTQVLLLTGNPVYADAVENTWYNALLGSINFAGNVRLWRDPAVSPGNDYHRSVDFVRSIGGFPFDSYSPLYKSRRNRKVGGYQDLPDGKSYGCCACIGGAGVAKLAMSALLLDRNGGLVLNHYFDGTFTAELGDGRQVTLTLATRYPYDGRVDVSVKTDGALSLTVRVPSWSDGRLEGLGALRLLPSGTYQTLSVKDGDRFSLLFDRSVTVITLNGKAAVKRGPIVFALDERNADIDTAITDTVVATESAEPSFACRETFRARFSNGACPVLTDYASAGSNWDEEHCLLTAWMDLDGTKE